MNIIALALVTASLAAQQEDPAALKKKLMDQVRARLAKEREQILARIGTVIDEELAKLPAGAGMAEKIDQRIETLEKEIADRQFELRAMAMMKTDLPVIEALEKDAPKNGEEVSKIFQDSFKALSEEKDFEKGNRGFKVLYYALKDQADPRLSFQATISAYNIACGYSLLSKEQAELALDWLEISLRRGYADRAQGCSNGCQYDNDPHSSFEHMEIDPDLENVRDTPRWKEIVKKFKPPAERPEK